MSDQFKTEKADLGFHTHLELIGSMLRFTMAFRSEMIAEHYYDELEHKFKAGEPIIITLKARDRAG